MLKSARLFSPCTTLQVSPKKDKAIKELLKRGKEERILMLKKMVEKFR